MPRFRRFVVTLIVASTCVFAQNPRESELKAAIDARPTELESYLELARWYTRDGRRDDADRLLRTALKIHRDSAAVYDALASLYVRGDDEKLLAITDEWLKVAPSDPKPFVLAAEVHRRRAREHPQDALMHLDRALTLLHSAVEHSPDDPMPSALRLGVMIQMLSLTSDPAVRTQLQSQIDQAKQETEKRWRDRGVQPGASLSGQPALPTRDFNTKYPSAVRVGGAVRMPAKIKDVKPQMPELAVKAGVQGVVILEIHINEQGHVSDARVLRSIPLLDVAAIDAVKQWQFEPTAVDGRPVAVILTATVQFLLAPNE